MPNGQNVNVQIEYGKENLKEIFNMYVNKGMLTIKIAEELNRREIEPPAIYLKIPTYHLKDWYIVESVEIKQF